MASKSNIEILLDEISTLIDSGIYMPDYIEDIADANILSIKTTLQNISQSADIFEAFNDRIQKYSNHELLIKTNLSQVESYLYSLDNFSDETVRLTNLQVDMFNTIDSYKNIVESNNFKSVGVKEKFLLVEDRVKRLILIVKSMSDLIQNIKVNVFKNRSEYASTFINAKLLTRPMVRKLIEDQYLTNNTVRINLSEYFLESTANILKYEVILDLYSSASIVIDENNISFLMIKGAYRATSYNIHLKVTNKSIVFNTNYSSINPNTTLNSTNIDADSKYTIQSVVKVYEDSSPAIPIQPTSVIELDTTDLLRINLMYYFTVIGEQTIERYILYEPLDNVTIVDNWLEIQGSNRDISYQILVRAVDNLNKESDNLIFDVIEPISAPKIGTVPIVPIVVNEVYQLDLSTIFTHPVNDLVYSYGPFDIPNIIVSITGSILRIIATYDNLAYEIPITATTVNTSTVSKSSSISLKFRNLPSVPSLKNGIDTTIYVDTFETNNSIKSMNNYFESTGDMTFSFNLVESEYENANLYTITSSTIKFMQFFRGITYNVNVIARSENNAGVGSLTFQVTEYPLEHPSGNGFDSVYGDKTYYELHDTPLVLSNYFTGYNMDFETKLTSPLVYYISRVYYINNETETNITDHSFEIIENTLYFGNNVFNNRDTYIEITAQNKSFSNVLQTFKQTLVLRENTILPSYSFEGSSVFNYVNEEGNRTYIIYDHSAINAIDLSLVTSGLDLSYTLSGPTDKIGNNITLTDNVINFSESYGNSVYDIEVSVSNYRFDGLKNTTSFIITLYENVVTPSTNQSYIQTIPLSKLYNQLTHINLDQLYTISLSDLFNNTATAFDVKLYEERGLINEINDPTIYQLDLVNKTLTLNRRYLNMPYYVNITASNVISWDPSDPYIAFVYNGENTLVTTRSTSYILNVIDDIKVPKFVDNVINPWVNNITLKNGFYNVNLLNYFTGDDITFSVSIEYTSSYAASNVILAGGNMSIIGNYRNNTYKVTITAANTNFNNVTYTADSYIEVVEEQVIAGEVVNASLIINTFIVNNVMNTMINTVYKDTPFTLSLYGMFINYTSLSVSVVDSISNSQILFNNSNIEVIGETINVSVNYRNMSYYIRVIVDEVNVYYFPVNETIRIPELISNLEMTNVPMLPVDENTMDYSIDLNNYFIGDQIQFELTVIEEDRVTILNNDGNSIVGIENNIMTIHSNYRNKLYFIKVVAFNVDHNNGQPNVTEPTYLTILESRMTIQEDVIQNLIVTQHLTESYFIVNLTHMFVDNVPDDFSYKILDSEKVMLLTTNITPELYQDENSEWIFKINGDYKNKKYYVRVFASYTTANNAFNDIYVDFEFTESIRPPYTVSDEIFEMTMPNGTFEDIDLHQYINGPSITYEIISVTLDGVSTPHSYYITNDILYLENTYTETNEVLVTVRGSNQDFLGNTFYADYSFKIINLSSIQTPEGSTDIENIKKTYNVQRLLGNNFGEFALYANNNGSVYTIGSNYSGQLGNNTSGNNSVTRQVPNIEDVILVQGGEYHSVALKSNGKVFTWGANSSGQLGDGTTIRKLIPTLVPGISNIVSIACGSEHTLALDSNGKVYAWGANSMGQIGDGTKVNKSSPVLVQGLVNIVYIACGYSNSIAIDSSGIPYIWGDTSFGRIGSEEYLLLNPVVVGGVTNVKSVAAGDMHIAFLQSSGNVYIMGGNAYIQFGATSSSATLVPDLSSIVQIACGINHIVALDSVGNVYAWGANNGGQLGDGTQVNKSSPVLVQGVANIISIACGYDNTNALDLSGNVYSWGSNSSGQIGNGLIGTNVLNPQISIEIGTLFPISILQSTDPIVLNDESKVFKLSNYFVGYKRLYSWSIDTNDDVDINIVTNIFNESLLIINSEFRNTSYNVTVTASPFDANPSVASVSYVFAVVEVVPPPFLKNNGFENLSKIFSYSAETLTYNVSDYFGGYNIISVKQVINVNTQAVIQYDSSWITIANGILSVYTLNRNMEYNIVVLAQRSTTIDSVEYVFETESVLRITENNKPVSFKLV